MKTAADVMQTSIVTVSPHDPLYTVQRLFYEEGIHGAPVIDEQGRLRGIISNTDILRAAVEARDLPTPESGYSSEDVDVPFGWGLTQEQFRERLNDVSVMDFMTEEIVQVAKDTPISEVARTLREQKVHRVLVADDGKLWGIVSALDLVALLED